MTRLPEEKDVIVLLVVLGVLIASLALTWIGVQGLLGIGETEEFSDEDVIEFSAVEEFDGPYSYEAWSGMADDAAVYMQFNNETREWGYSRKGGE